MLNNFTLEQQQALAIASAKRRRAEAEAGASIAAPAEPQKAAPRAANTSQIPVDALPMGLQDSMIQSGEASVPDAVSGFAADAAKATGSRGTFRAAGGTAGSVLGMLAGKSPQAAYSGGVLGAAGGDALYNVLESTKNAITGEKSTTDPLQSPIDAAKDEALWTGVLGEAGKAARAVSPAIGKLIGATGKEAKELKTIAEKWGIPLGAINVTPNETVKAFAKVAGVFPFIGTPIRKNTAIAEKALDQKIGDTLNDVAPTATLQELGVDLTKAATTKFKSFRGASKALYDDFLNKADNATVKEIFPTSNIKQVAKDIQSLSQKEAIKLGESQTPGGSKFNELMGVPKATEEVANTKSFRKMTNPHIENFLKDTLELPDNITATQVRGLQRDLQGIMKKTAAEGFDISRGVKLKKALELDFNSPDVTKLPEQEAADMVNSLKRANEFFATNVKQFETVTGKKFGRVDKNIFKPQFFKPGSRQADEAFSAVFNSKSPEALNDLRTLVGPDPFRKAARKHLDQSLEKAIVEKENGVRSFDPDALESALGLDSPEGRNTLKELLKGSPVKVQKLEELVKISKSIGSVEIPNVSTFLRRRAVLGGARAILTTVGAGAAMMHPIHEIVFLAAGRKLSKVLSNPASLDAMTTALDSTLPQKVQRAAAFRLLRNIPDMDEKEKNQLINELRKQ